MSVVKEESSAGAVPGFTFTDVGVIVGVPLLLPVAWLMPERYWPTLGRLLAGMAISGLTDDRLATERVIGQALADQQPPLKPEDVLKDMACEGIVTFFQVLRSHRWDRWQPKVNVTGAERVTAAQQAGRGAILWVAHGFHGHLGAKVGFHQAGLRVSHLSRPTHGFSPTRFGARYLNRIQTVIEDRFLGERIMLPLDGQNTAVNRLTKRLRANGVISITAQRGSGRSVETAFMGARLVLATGAPTLAHLTGAALLPVFAFRDAGNIVNVSIDGPIDCPADLPRDEAIARTMASYAGMLEPYVRRYPGQWLGWPQMEP